MSAVKSTIKKATTGGFFATMKDLLAVIYDIIHLEDNFKLATKTSRSVIDELELVVQVEF